MKAYKITSIMILVMSFITTVVILAQVQFTLPRADFDLTFMQRSSDMHFWDDVKIAWDCMCKMDLVTSLQYNALPICGVIATFFLTLGSILNVGRWANSVYLLYNLVVSVGVCQCFLVLAINSYIDFILLLLGGVMFAGTLVNLVLQGVLLPFPKLYAFARRCFIIVEIGLLQEYKVQLVGLGQINPLDATQDLVIQLVVFELVADVLAIIEGVYKYVSKTHKQEVSRRKEIS